MTANELFLAMPTPLAQRILEEIHASDKDLYRVAVSGVAQARKLRPIFLERQPKADRHKFMASVLAHKSLEMVAANIVSGWLVKNQSALLCDFLDGLKIKHEKGVVEGLPDTVSDADLDNTINALLAKHEPQIVALYLQAFGTMNDVNWPKLTQMLNSDLRLQIG